MILDGAKHVDGWLLTLDEHFLAKRKIMLDGTEHGDGRLLTLDGR